MNKFESPTDFETEFSCSGHIIRYSNLVEIVQGGPVVGKLFIDDTPVGNYHFGGPALYHDNKLFAPMFIRKFCISGFRLCVIDLERLNVYFISKIKNLIYLDHIKDNQVFYYESHEKRQMHSFRIDLTHNQKRYNL